ncbi:carboxypeptidase-like regulatory domain-containing protein [Polaribacter uvawellassae]|uniref:carboxypeptidase-like regulatory domain-containing protein n=1 Tax=Polaribacter uvawellassae TaxID=3133495 RepID=UPI00321A2CDD
MKKGLLTFLLFCISISVFSQTYIEGKVTTNTNEILEGASVYLNNTTIGTTTNSKGEFTLKVQKGNYDLVVSFIGHTTSRIKVNTNLKVDFLHIKLTLEVNVLDEVVLRKTKYDDDWKYNLSRFKSLFLGKTKLAEKAIILNPKTLHFEYNIKTDELIADAKEPLKIKHESLGYLITYDLVHFSVKKNRLFFSGYARYTNLKKKIKKKWKRNRLEAYNGSQMHFLRSLLEKNLTVDGFVINQFKRELNPERPTDADIKSARELIYLNREIINYSKKITIPLTPLDSALVIVQKSSKPKYQDFLYKRNVDYNEMISFEKQTPFLDFENHLSIIYKNEKEEENYLRGMFGKRKKASGVQTSNITLINGKSIIDPSGVLVNPNAIFIEGYWAFESFANMLPLDYIPIKN